MTNTLPALPVLPSDGPVNPADHPNGIVWADIEVNYQTGKFYYVDRLIPVDEWNERYAMNPKEIEAFKAECAARAAKPFRFVDPEEFGHFYGDEKWISPLFMETARQSSQRLNDLLDQLKGDVIPPVWLKRHCPSSEQSGRFDVVVNGGFGSSGFSV